MELLLNSKINTSQLETHHSTGVDGQERECKALTLQLSLHGKDQTKSIHSLVLIRLQTYSEPRMPTQQLSNKEDSEIAGTFLLLLLLQSSEKESRNS